MNENPYVRPRCGKALTGRPAIVSVAEQCLTLPNITFYAGEFYDLASHVIWTCEYALRYLTGEVGGALHLRQIAAATRQEALRKLQEELVGFGIAEILLVRVIEPPSRAEILRLNAANEQLHRAVDAAWAAGWFGAEQRQGQVNHATVKEDESEDLFGDNRE